MGTKKISNIIVYSIFWMEKPFRHIKDVDKYLADIFEEENLKNELTKMGAISIGLELEPHDEYPSRKHFHIATANFKQSPEIFSKFRVTKNCIPPQNRIKIYVYSKLTKLEKELSTTELVAEKERITMKHEELLKWISGKIEGVLGESIDHAHIICFEPMEKDIEVLKEMVKTPDVKKYFSGDFTYAPFYDKYFNEHHAFIAEDREKREIKIASIDCEFVTFDMATNVMLRT